MAQRACSTPPPNALLERGVAQAFMVGMLTTTHNVGHSAWLTTATKNHVCGLGKCRTGRGGVGVNEGEMRNRQEKGVCPTPGTAFTDAPKKSPPVTHEALPEDWGGP